MTTVIVNTYTHSATYVADNVLKSLKDIIRLSGLNPTKLVDSWDSKMRALKTWLASEDLEQIVLEIYSKKTGHLVIRWDIDVSYGWTGEGGFWTDTDQLRYHIQKAGVASSDTTYDILLKTKLGRPDVAGWSRGSFRSTEGLARHKLGATIDHNGLSASAAYWRRS